MRQRFEVLSVLVVPGLLAFASCGRGLDHGKNYPCYFRGGFSGAFECEIDWNGVEHGCGGLSSERYTGASRVVSQHSSGHLAVKERRS